jgi:hypothetical protein
MPKFGLFVRATATSESGQFPPDSEELFKAMGAFNNSLVEAGALIDADGFLPTSRGGARVHFTSKPGAEPAVTRGPFDPASLVSGYWIIKAASLDEAISWAKKVPFKADDAVVEVRQVAGEEDFGDFLTEDLKKQRDKLLGKLGEQAA